MQYQGGESNKVISAIEQRSRYHPFTFTPQYMQYQGGESNKVISAIEQRSRYNPLAFNLNTCNIKGVKAIR